MANTTFQGPVRSEGGFQTVSKNATTGAVTVTSSTGTGTSPVTAGSGIDCIYSSSVERVGTRIVTKITMDLTDLGCGGTANDIIGGDGGAANSHIGQYNYAVSGTPIYGYMKCFEVPTGGDPDIDVYSAVEATGAENAAVTDLTETKLVDSGDLTLGSEEIFTALPADGEYLYLACGTATEAAYTAGKIEITIVGYDA